MKFKIKMDRERVGVILYTLVFALFLKLIFDNIKMSWLTNIPSWITFAIAPILAIIIAQQFGEGKKDYKEAIIFVVAMVSINFIIGWIVPSAGDLNVMNSLMTTTSGMVATLLAYFITIPLSVIVADAVTDRR